MLSKHQVLTKPTFVSQLPSYNWNTDIRTGPRYVSDFPLTLAAHSLTSFVSFSFVISSRPVWQKFAPWAAAHKAWPEEVRSVDPANTHWKNVHEYILHHRGGPTVGPLREIEDSCGDGQKSHLFTKSNGKWKDFLAIEVSPTVCSHTYLYCTITFPSCSLETQYHSFLNLG